MEIKPGWKTSEFWVTSGVLLAGMAVHLGFVNSADVAAFSDGWSKAVAAIFTLTAQVAAAVVYIRGRQTIKASVPTSEPPPAAVVVPPVSVLPMLIAGLVLLVGLSPAHAQSAKDRPPIITVSSDKTPAYLLPWRQFMADQANKQQQQPAPQPQQSGTDPALLMMLMQQRQQGTDPALLMVLQQQQHHADPATIAALNQIVFLNQQIVALMQAGNHAPIQIAPQIVPLPAPAPAPVAPVAPVQPAPQYHFYNTPPGVQPFPSAPTAPVQPFPIAPVAPLQPFPMAPPGPVQPFPQVAPAPAQPFPVAPKAPVQPFPVAPPAPAAPLPIAPPGMSPQALPAAPAAGFQRFTRAIAAPVK